MFKSNVVELERHPSSKLPRVGIQKRSTEVWAGFVQVLSKLHVHLSSYTTNCVELSPGMRIVQEVRMM